MPAWLRRLRPLRLALREAAGGYESNLVSGINDAQLDRFAYRIKR